MTENIFDMLDQKNLYLVKVDIFSRLDYRSLHTCRQVCKEWNELVREEFWFSRTRRPLMKNRLLTEWKTAEPLRKTFNLPSTRGFYLACDNKTVCVGTRNSQAIVLDTDTGQQLASLACDPRSDLSESDVLDDESRDVQLDLTESHIVTVTGSGVISVWRREGLDLIYQSSHHGQDSILGVSLVGDLLITGSSHGSLAALTVRSDTVTLDWVSSTKKMRAISHIHSDGSNVVVGTDVGMSVWDFQDRRRPQLIRDIPCGQVCCCVLSLPLAACTGLFLNSGLQLWDFLTGQKLRSVSRKYFRISDLFSGTSSLTSTFG